MSRKKKTKRLKKDSSRKNYFTAFFILVLIVIFPFIHSYETIDFNASPRIMALSVFIMLVSLYHLLIDNKRDDHGFAFLKLAVFPVSLLYLLWSIITLIPSAMPGEGSYDIVKSFLTLSLVIYSVKLFNEDFDNSLNLLVKSVIVSAFIAGFAGLYQYLENVPGKSGFDLYSALYKVKGLMSHKNQFAISLMMMLPFTVYGLLFMNKLWRFLSGFATLLLVLNIVLVQTRSVWIAILFFIFIVPLLSFIFLRENNLKNLVLKYRKVLILSSVLILIGLSVVFVVVSRTGAARLMKQQAQSTFSTKSQNAQWRLKMWNSSLQLAEDHLLLGVGAGNWKSAVIPYYHLNFGSHYQNWRRPHNDFLWVLTEKGMPGLLLFLVIFVLVFFYGFKILFNQRDKNRLFLTILILTGTGSYLVASFFTFPLERINHQVYLAVFLALIISMYYKNQSERNESNLFSRVNIVIFILSLFSVYYSYLAVRQEVTVRKIANAMNTGRNHRAIKYCDLAYTPFTTIDNNNIPIKMYRGVINLRLKNYRQSYSDFKQALEEFPNQISVLNNLAIATSELKRNKEALEYLDKALYLFPHFEKSLVNQTIVYFNAGDYRSAYISWLNQNTKTPNKQYNRFKTDLERRLNK